MLSRYRGRVAVVGGVGLRSTRCCRLPFDGRSMGRLRTNIPLAKQFISSPSFVPLSPVLLIGNRVFFTIQDPLGPPHLNRMCTIRMRRRGLLCCLLFPDFGGLSIVQCSNRFPVLSWKSQSASSCFPSASSL
ncbi:hypothetical protein BDW75DRAFT_221949 [Aspergillus navahoensis]